jgi:hypothetical protein
MLHGLERSTELLMKLRYIAPALLMLAVPASAQERLDVIPPVNLATAAAATGATAGQDWSGGVATWQVWGTWGGATAQLQSTPNSGGLWLDYIGATLTANGGFRGMYLEPGQYRINITNCSGCSLSSTLKRAQ